MPPEKPGTGGKETTPDYNRNRNQTHQQTQHVNRPVYNEPQNVIGGGNKPDNYLVWAILTTVLCCFVVGIPSIIYSTKVDSLWAAGQYAEARAASEKAKQFAIYSAIAAVVCWVLYFVLVVAGSMGGGY